MENDGTDNWQKLGDVVARIMERREVTTCPPLPVEDARAFVELLGWAEAGVRASASEVDLAAYRQTQKYDALSRNIATPVRPKNLGRGVHRDKAR
jgi:hypothetical protein